MPEVPGERESLDWTHLGRVLARPPAVRAELAWISDVVPRRAFAYPEHRHVLYEILVPRRGVYRCRIDGGAWIAAAPGQAVIVQPGDRHEDVLRAGQRYRAVGLRLVWGARAEAGLLGAGLPAQRRVVTVALDDLLDLIAAEVARGDAIAARRQDALAEELLWRLVRALPAASLAPAWRGDAQRDRFVADLERVFRERGGRGLSVPAIARALGLGATALTSACRRHLGLPPARALARWRVEQARRLLADSDLPVAAIAARLGFANPYHFTRVVRRHAGAPPSRLRREG